jgi:uncharacterized protein YndB with AHSA1/START domain
MGPESPWRESADAGSATAVVYVSRELTAPRDEVFRAWTEPDLFKRWFTPPGNASVTAELDVRPGGSYRIKLERTELVPGTSYIVGNYLEVVPPQRLVFTFGWEEPPPLEGMEALEMLDSRVTVQFRDVGGSTELNITHERLDTPALRAFHRLGWESTLDQLARVV